MSRAEPLPLFSLWVADFIAATYHLPLEAKGLILDALLLSWRIGPIPSDAKAAALRLGLSPRLVQRHWSAISTLFRETPDGLVCDMVEREYARGLENKHARQRGGIRAKEQREAERRATNAERSAERGAELGAEHGAEPAVSDPAAPCPSPSPSPSHPPSRPSSYTNPRGAPTAARASSDRADHPEIRRKTLKLAQAGEKPGDIAKLLSIPVKHVREILSEMKQ